MHESLSESEIEKQIRRFHKGISVQMCDNQKHNISQFALKKMREVGIRSVSIDDICRELGISKKTFYVYFESKDKLVDEILSVQEQEIERKMLRKVEGMSVLQILSEWGHIAKTNGRSVEQPPPMVYDLEKYYPELFARHKEHLCEIMYRNLVRFIKKGQDEEIFRPELDVELTAKLFSYSHYFLLETIQQYPKRREEIGRLGRHGFDLLIRGVLRKDVQITVNQ